MVFFLLGNVSLVSDVGDKPFVNKFEKKNLLSVHSLSKMDDKNTRKGYMII